MTGVPAIAHIPSMATFIPFELMFNHAGKLRHMTGGQASFPMVLWADMARRDPYQGGQHADAGLESAYARLAGLKVVIPSTPYDAKGLMVSAIRDVDPVVFCHYPMPAAGPEVPDDPYTVPIGEAAVRCEGKDLTIVGYAPQTAEIAKAVEQLKQDGISAEFIDPRTFGALGERDGADRGFGQEDRPAADRRRGLLQFLQRRRDHRARRRGRPRREGQTPGVPRRAGPGAPEMIQYMKVDAARIAAAARTLVQA